MKLSDWVEKAKQRMDSFNVEENLEVLVNSVNMRSLESDHAKFMGKVTLKNSKAKIVTANSFHAGPLSFSDATASRLTDISNRQSTLQTMTKRVAEKLKFSMATGKRIRRSTSPLIEDLIVTDELQVKTINGKKISNLLTQSRKASILRGLQAKEVQIDGKLFVDNKIDGVDFTEDNLILNRPQSPLRPFTVENLTVKSLNDVVFVNKLKFQEFFISMKQKNSLKLPTKFQNLNANDIILRKLLNDHNFTEIVDKSLKLTGDQFFDAPVSIGKLTAKKLSFLESLPIKAISNIPIAHLIDTQNREKHYFIQQDIQFTRNLTVNDLRVTNRISNINVVNGVLQVMRKSGDIKKQVVTGEKFFNRVKLMSPIVLRGKIRSNTLDMMNPMKIVDEKLVLQGDYRISGPVTVRKVVNATNDIKCVVDPNLSLRRLSESGLNLHTSKSTKCNLNFKNVVEVLGNLNAISVNQKIVENFVKCKYPNVQTIEAPTTFNNSVLVQNGKVECEIVNDVDILQLNRTTLKKFHPGTQFITGNVEIATLHTPKIISQEILCNGKNLKSILSRNGTQQIKKLIAGRLNASNMKIHSLKQNLVGSTVLGEDLSSTLADLVRKDSNEAIFIQPKSFSQLNVDHLKFDESNKWKGIVTNYESALSQEVTFDENIEFRNEMLIDHLEVSGMINEVSFDDINNNWLRVEGEQTFTASQFFDSIEIEKNLDVLSTIVNNVNISDVIERSVWLDDPIVNFKELVVDNDMIVKNEVLSPTVNGVFLDKMLLLNSKKEIQEVNELSGHDLFVGYLDFTHINNIDCDKFIKGFTDNADKSTLHVKRGIVKFNTHPSLYHLNDLDLKELYETVWISNRDTRLTGENIKFLGNVKVFEDYTIYADVSRQLNFIICHRVKLLFINSTER